MAKQFKFPDIGEGITEGEIIKWLVKEGEAVKEDQSLAEIETDKAIVEMPSPYSGTVLKLHFKEKDIVKVGQVLVTIGVKDEKIIPAAKEAAALDEARTPETSSPAPSVVGEIRESPDEIRDILATPQVRRLALKLNIDLKAVQGTGPQGRITEEDVKRFMTAPEERIEKKAAVKIKAKFDFYGALDRIPLRGIRRATAKRMSESVSKAAHVTHFDEADVTELAKIRSDLKHYIEKKAKNITYLPFIIKAVIAALKKHPFLNSSLDDEEEEIIVKNYYNIGIAVDVPDGLIVPVIKAADQKSLFELAEEILQLAESAKKRSLDLADLKGGTFSITNVGMIGGEFATPIINYPEVAILATLRIKDKMRVEKGTAAVRTILPLCLSFDHRVIDGAEAARFMNDLIQYLQDAEQLKKDSKIL